MESTISVRNPNPNCDLEETIQTRPNDDPWSRKKKKGEIFLEGYLETDGREEMQMQHQWFSRTISLTEDDLDELKGCLDLGFGFSYEEIPELCNTLPALELCYSMSQRFLDEQQRSPEAENDAVSTESCSSGAASSPMANWKISSPGMLIWVLEFWLSFIGEFNGFGNLGWII